MSERVLCDDGLRVTVDGGGERTLVAVRDGASIRFWADTAIMERVLGGEPVQLSAHGGYCGLEAKGGRVRLEFGIDGMGRKSCDFPAGDLAEALAMVRSLPTPSAAPAGTDAGGE